MTRQEARRQQRAENLDARGGQYWQAQDIDFGSEPGEADHGVWNCNHVWANRADDIEGEVEIDCHMCWDPITEMCQANLCDSCGLLACGKCAKAEN